MDHADGSRTGRITAYDARMASVWDGCGALGIPSAGCARRDPGRKDRARAIEYVKHTKVSFFNVLTF